MTRAYKERVDKGVRRSAYVEVVCPCGKTFEVRRARYEAGRGRRCSKACQYAYMERPSGLTYEKHKENPTSFKPGERASTATEFKPGQTPWNEGVPTGVVPPNAFKPGENLGSTNPRWAGDAVRYGGLHQRVYRAYGAAREYRCTYADVSCKGPMQWANVSGEYLGTEDFMPLCQSHHVRYDRANGFWGISATPRINEGREL